MNKELQNLAWRCLPKEFKEEVKKIFYTHENNEIKTYLIHLFGEHNITSDAKGEEMLTVSRKRVQEMYAHYDKICNDPNRPRDYIESIYEYADGVTIALDDLFGSKCLPDEEQSKQKDCDNPLADKEGCRWRNDGKCAFYSACYFEPLNPQEPKPAKPKYNVGDKVRISCAYENGEIWDNITHGRVVTIKSIYRNATNNDIWMYQFEEEIRDFSECWLSLYPDQEYEEGNLPTIDDRRLNIAAMILSGLLASGKDKHPVKRAIELTDSIIAEVEKEGKHALSQPIVSHLTSDEKIKENGKTYSLDDMIRRK